MAEGGENEGELPSVDHGPLNEGPWEKAESNMRISETIPDLYYFHIVVY